MVYPGCVPWWVCLPVYTLYMPSLYTPGYTMPATHPADVCATVHHRGTVRVTMALGSRRRFSLGGRSLRRVIAQRCED